MDKINIEKVIEIAQMAGEKILTIYHEDPKQVQMKADGSPFTIADEVADHFIRNELKKLNPQVPIVSEESPLATFAERKQWNRYFLVDALDGTKEFLKKNGEFTVNIAVIENQKPIMGVVFVPVSQETFVGVQGKGSFEISAIDGERKPLIYTQPQPAQEVVVVESRSHESKADLEDPLKQFEVTKKIKVGSSLKFCALAQAKAHFYIRTAPSMEWDLAAGDAVYRYATENVKENYSPLKYNKPNLRERGFLIGGDYSTDLDLMD